MYSLKYLERQTLRTALNLKQSGSPSKGPEAFWLWRVLSNSSFPIIFSRRAYLLGGYEPFAGYPLKKRGADVV